jgi:putative nucleotidyltransferase with HDIG domain
MYTVTIKTENAKPGMVLAESIYHATAKDSQMLIARKDSELTNNVIRMLKSINVTSVDVFTKVRPPDEHPEIFAPVKSIFNEQIRAAAVNNVKELFCCFTEDGCLNKSAAVQCVNNLDGVVGDLLDTISDEKTGLVHINDLKKFDEFTYHHSLSVSVLALATGKGLGLSEDALSRLGRCALLHDIGKQLVPLSILNKNGKLTEEEFETIKKHPLLGANNLKDSALVDDEIFISIMSHHEKVNGLGYPYNLRGNEIPLYSKIISVADVYDAITSYRSYRTPLQPLEAFEVIFKDIGNSFDYDVVKAFYSKLEFYPVNTIVELSDNRLAVVVPGGGSLKLRPPVRLWGTDKIIDLSASANKDLSVARALAPSELPTGYEFA